MPVPALIYLLSFIGLAASSVLLVDYTSSAPVFCAAGGGCDLVRASPYAEIFGVHTPWFGLAFFIGALILTLIPARRLLVAWSAAGALAALGFLGVQLFVLRTFCVYCGVADGAALALFAAALLGRRRLVAGRPLFALAAAAAAVGVISGPYVVARARPAPPVAAAEAAGVPQAILAERRPGVATIIEFVDFECPFCRRLHHTLERIVAAYGDKVRIVRKQQPLGSIHPHAVTAAHAACCADEQGAAAGDRMAAALVAAPTEELTAAGCERLAAEAGLDVAAWKSCMASERPARQVEADQVIARAAGIEGSAPVFYIGAEQFRGALPEAVIRAAIDRELARR
jgi:protein-disulfide isomerase/uncharacterized membrane protein